MGGQEEGRNEGKPTDSTLRQPSQRLQIITANAVIIKDINLTIVVDVGDDAVQLQRGLDQPRYPEDEEDEAPDDDDTGEEEAARGEDENEDHEAEAKGGGDDHVGEEPLILLLV